MTLTSCRGYGFLGWGRSPQPDGAVRAPEPFGDRAPRNPLSVEPSHVSDVRAQLARLANGPSARRTCPKPKQPSGSQPSSLGARQPAWSAGEPSTHSAADRVKPCSTWGAPLSRLRAGSRWCTGLGTRVEPSWARDPIAVMSLGPRSPREPLPEWETARAGTLPTP